MLPSGSEAFALNVKPAGAAEVELIEGEVSVTVGDALLPARLPESSRSKLRSELVVPLWWTSTAIQLVPSNSNDGLTELEK